MKKNLKKVISAVIALALSLSSVATISFAANFSDVPSTASYAEAVEVLSALGIVSGKGENKFDPEGLVKRSEAAKMVAGMVNALANAEKRAGKTNFNDVAENHWATGYINYGVSQGWLSGKGGNRFDADGNVKYAELIKMVVVNMGWTASYLESFASYPKAYTNKAEEYEVVGIGEYDYDEYATRADVAEIIYNAMKAPIARDGKESDWSDSKGTWVTKPVAQDGEDGTKYRSLLSEKFDAYYVEGMVTKTAKTNTSYKNEVDFTIVKTEKYAETEAATAGALTKISAGNSNAADLINTYAAAIIKIDEDTKEKEVLAIFPSAKNKTVTLDASLIEENMTATGLVDTNKFKDTEIEYYASEDAARADKYDIHANTELYVNGVKVAVDTTNVNRYLINNKIGKVELVDVFGKYDNTNKGEVDCIYVEYYTTAEVTGVADSVISLKNFKNLVGTPGVIDLDTEDREDLVYNIYLNGAKASINDIKKGDVLSIAWNVNKNIDANDSLFYEIYVSRDVVSGKVANKNSREKTITVAGEAYSAVLWTDVDDDAEVKTTNEYDFKLDAFGRIYDVEEIQSNEKYAMIIGAGNSGVSGDAVQLLLPDGTKPTYNLKKGVKVQKWDATANGNQGAYADYAVATIRNDLAVQDVDFTKFVVKYTMKDGLVTSMTVLEKQNTPAKDEFDARTGKVSGMTISASTIVFDATKAELKNTADDLKVGSYASFVDEDKYKVYGYEKDGSKWKIAVITAGESSYSANTAFAVVSKSAISSSNPDNEEELGFEIEIVENGETKALFIEEGTKVGGSNVASGTFTVGDVIVYTTDAAGEVEDVQILFSVVAKASGYQDTIYAAFNNDTAVNAVNLPVVGGDWVKGWNPASRDAISLIYAPIVEVEDDVMILAQVKNNVTNWEDDTITESDSYVAADGSILAVSFDDETRVTVYDYANAKNPVKAGALGNIYGYMTRTDANPQVQNDYEKIEWTGGQNGAMNAKAAKNYAFAKVVDGVATDVYVIMVEAK